MQCDIRVSSFAPVVFQLAPQYYVTARFDASRRGTVGRVVSHLFLGIVFGSESWSQGWRCAHFVKYIDWSSRCAVRRVLRESQILHGL